MTSSIIVCETGLPAEKSVKCLGDIAMVYWTPLPQDKALDLSSTLVGLCVPWIAKLTITTKHCQVLCLPN